LAVVLATTWCAQAAIVPYDVPVNVLGTGGSREGVTAVGGSEFDVFYGGMLPSLGADVNGLRTIIGNGSLTNVRLSQSGDFDGDGDTDLFVVRNNQEAFIVTNTGAVTSAWTWDLVYDFRFSVGRKETRRI
jgi:hypothetical protein